MIELLIEIGADLNYPAISETAHDVRAIHIASMWGYELTIKLLILHGADVGLRDSNGLSPVDYATIFDNYLCVSYLLRYGPLNSTTTTRQAVMSSSLGESNADSSFEEYLYITALDIGEDDNRQDSCISPSQPDSGDVNEGDQSDYDPLDLIRDEDIDLNIDNQKLRSDLRRLGRQAGPITDTTKKLYVKLLAYLAKVDKELVYSPRTTTKSQLSGYSVQLSSIITGKFSTKQALDLEKEFLRLSGTRDYHGPKQFFNYVLIDPRISKNLPEQALEASDSDTSRMSPGATFDPKQAMRNVNRKFNPRLFSKFIESIFYIGKGQKRRDLMHLYDALADRSSITKKKIDRIRSIWDEGYGVVSLHIFHNITDKEALTREALMIEALGLNNLTNLMHGTLQFKLGWNEHKRKLLGSLLVHRAYTQLLNEGERQLKRDDLKLDKCK